jgi:hypothetical protein
MAVGGPALLVGQDRLWYSFSAQDSVFAMLGLAAYDKAEGSGKPHLMVSRHRPPCSLQPGQMPWQVTLAVASYHTTFTAFTH